MSNTLALDGLHTEDQAAKTARRAPPPVWFKKEDSWAIIIGLGLVVAATVLFLVNKSGVLPYFTFSAPGWKTPAELAAKLPTKLPGALGLFLLLASTLTLGARSLGYDTRRFLRGFVALYLLAVAVLIISANAAVKGAQLETPLVALFVGLVIGNTLSLPAWFSEALRTEYYVKTGIVLMGATLPFTIILRAGPAAIGHEAATEAFTLMKVVGRDMFVGIWAFLVAILAVTVWERQSAAQSERIDRREIWRRFPKFILGFFIASLLTTAVISVLNADAGKAYSAEALKTLKDLRGCFFTLTFLSIGLTTRFRELAAVGLKPFFAFAVGVAINLPLGYWLSNHVFDAYWRSLGA